MYTVTMENAQLLVRD